MFCLATITNLAMLQNRLTLRTGGVVRNGECQLLHPSPRTWSNFRCSCVSDRERQPSETMPLLIRSVEPHVQDGASSPRYPKVVLGHGNFGFCSRATNLTKSQERWRAMLLRSHLMLACRWMSHYKFPISPPSTCRVIERNCLCAAFKQRRMDLDTCNIVHELSGDYKSATT